MRFDFLFSPNWNRKKKCLVHNRNIIHFKGLMCGSNKSSVEPWRSVCYMVHPVKAVVHLSLRWGSQLRTDVISVNCPCYWWFQKLGRCSDFKRQYLSVILSCLFHWDCGLISLLYLSLYVCLVSAPWSHKQTAREGQTFTVEVCRCFQRRYQEYALCL